MVKEASTTATTSSRPAVATVTVAAGPGRAARSARNARATVHRKARLGAGEEEKNRKTVSAAADARNAASTGWPNRVQPKSAPGRNAVSNTARDASGARWARAATSPTWSRIAPTRARPAGVRMPRSDPMEIAARLSGSRNAVARKITWGGGGAEAAGGNARSAQL